MKPLLTHRRQPAVTRCRWLLLCCGFSLSLPAQVQVLKQTVVPNRIRPVGLVLSGAGAGHPPPSGRVNAPEFLKTLYPGQRIAVALMAEGPDRDKLLREAVVSVRFTSPSQGVTERHDLKPVAIRQIKAEGADMTLVALDAGGIAVHDRASLEEAMAMVSLAVFQPDWAAPPVKQAEEVQISLTMAGNAPASPPETVSLKLRPTADWLNEPTPGVEEYGKTMNHYHEDMSPGRLLAMLKGCAAEGKIGAPAIAGFFAHAYQADGPARRAALELFPSLDPRTQVALTFVLRLGDQDTSGLSPAAAPEVIASLKTVAPLKDPRELLHFPEPATPQAVHEMGVSMDQCWCGWMATGDQSYLRAMVGLLAWAPDFPAYQSWLKAKGGAAGFNSSVARGIAYQIAGWSIGSFQRTDPHAMDWLLFWSKDLSFPPALRHEIATLPGNPAFRRN